MAHTTRVIGVSVVVLVAAWFIFQAEAEPAKPPAFYTPPAGLPARPGSVIRTETLNVRSSGERIWRVLYTSTGPDKKPIAVSGIVTAPKGRAPASGWPVIAWAHGTTGIASRCAPSLEEEGGIARIPLLGKLIAAGNVVVESDYPGLGTPGPHPYLIGESEGRAVLDSIRAARSVLGRSASARSAVYGHSQGGHAALFAAQLAPSYAPDVRLAGVAAMAPPTDLAVLLRRDRREPAGIVLTALAVDSWSHLYPSAHESAIVHPVARPFVHRLGGRCLDTTEEGISDLPDVVALLARFLSADPANVSGWGPLLRKNSPSAVPTEVPLLVSQGLRDTLVRPDVTERFVRTQCRAGANIELDTYRRAGHFAVRTIAAPRVIAWLQERLRDEPAAVGCATKAQR